MIVTELSKGTKLYLLVGGKGTRLKSVTDTPKPLVDTCGIRFIERVLSNLKGFDITLVCSSLNEEWFKDIDCDVISEGEPSGTGGWLKKVDLPDEFYVMNGDTFFSGEFSIDTDTSTIFCTYEEIVGDEGYVEGENNQVQQFIEKNPEAIGKKKLVNAGIYKLYKKDIHLPDKMTISMEYDILPNVNLSYRVIDTRKFDIGTPERLETFKQWLIS